jgi:hypothetical protein
VTDPGDKPRAAPKLNRGTLEKPLGLLDSFAVVSANESPVPNKRIILESDEIGPVIWHALCPKAAAKSYAQTVDVDTGPLFRPATQYS